MYMYTYMYASVGALRGAPALKNSRGKRSIWQKAVWRTVGEAHNHQQGCACRAKSNATSNFNFRFHCHSNAIIRTGTSTQQHQHHHQHLHRHHFQHQHQVQQAHKHQHRQQHWHRHQHQQLQLHDNSIYTCVCLGSFPAWHRLPAFVFSLCQGGMPFLVVLCRVECPLCRVECPFSRVECPSRRVECPCLSSGGMPSLSGWNAPVCLMQRQEIGAENGHEKSRERLRVSRGAQASVEL